MLISSIGVLVSARKVIKNPAGHIKWGILVLIFSLAGWGAMFMPPAEAIELAVICILAFGSWGILNGIRAIRYKPLT